MKSSQAGALLAEALPDGAVLWADDLIEARPDLLLYTQRSAAAAGKRVDTAGLTALRSLFKMIFLYSLDAAKSGLVTMP
jgi:hypothetical protein